MNDAEIIEAVTAKLAFNTGMTVRIDCDGQTAIGTIRKIHSGSIPFEVEYTTSHHRHGRGLFYMHELKLP